MSKNSDKIIVYAGLALLIFFALFPIYMLLSNSLKTEVHDLYAMPPHIIPESPSLENFHKVLSYKVAFTIGDIEIPGIFLRLFFNSFFIAICVSLSTVALAALAGYSFSRFEFSGRRSLFSLVPISQMFPIITIGITLLTFFITLKLMNTYFGIVIGIIGFTLPFAIWQAKAFFDKIPRDLDGSALIDGCSYFQALFKVILPVARPGLIAIMIFSFLIAWDEYIWVLLLTTTDATRTIPLGITLLYFGEEAAKYHEAMAASLIFTVPVLILFFFFQKHLVSGLTAGAVKG